LRAGSERILPPQSVVKGYEYEKDRYVALDPEELKSIAPKTATEMQIFGALSSAEERPARPRWYLGGLCDPLLAVLLLKPDL
jgi:hypothetical protein